ncbi:CRISPR-associated endonuclease Cas2 [Propionicicella superfundia]|uniref:CRISPR-associated endonuclease Cas2 n=1 Tax=Propionicicella superfundia TaxID=348582 RepID=UPI0004153583|nr:CRISPR-associated endonuclease Cas2 [Propionicicella superfundia]
MTRRRYLIAYDIRDERRLRRVCKLMEGHGTRLQYSVFLCDLSDRELLIWRSDIVQLMELELDSVVYVDLGGVGATNVEVIGAPRQFPHTGPMIV